MSLESYEIAEFTLKPAQMLDLPVARMWTARDPDHRDRTLAEFWIEQGTQTNSFLLWDGVQPVFFFRIDMRPERQVEIHIQFSGTDALRESRTRRGLMEGCRWLEKMLSESGFEGYYFHSRNAQLIFFCQRRLGFEWDGRKLYRDLRRKDDGQARREEAQCAAGQQVRVAGQTQGPDPRQEPC